MSPFISLLITLVIISLFPIIGAVIGYIFLPHVSGKKSVLEVLSGGLMILLGLNLLLRHVLEVPITLLSGFQLFSGFAVGIAGAGVLMMIYHHLTPARKAIHVSIFLLCMLGLHEITEGAGIAELFFEPSSDLVLRIPLLPLAVLAIHEIPEGLLLILPFFIAKKVTAGLMAVLANQLLFLASGTVSYLAFSNFLEVSAAHHTLIETIPAGAILYIGIHELRMAREHAYHGDKTL